MITVEKVINEEKKKAKKQSSKSGTDDKKVKNRKLYTKIGIGVAVLIVLYLAYINLFKTKKDSDISNTNIP